MRIEGRVVLVTGANRGIGRALSLELGRRGAKVALAGRQQDELEAVRQEIERAGGSALAHEFDVQNDDEVQALVAAVIAHYGAIDILINNAGITMGGDIRLFSNADWTRVLGINLWGPIRTVRAVVPHMLERRTGYVVNIASAAGLIAPSLWTPYATSKFGLVGFSEGLCGALRPKGIGVSVACPMWVQTAIHEGPPPKLVDGERSGSSSASRLARWWSALTRRLPGREMPAETAARRIIRGIEHDCFLIYTHQWLRLLVIARAIAPATFSRFWDWINSADEQRRRSESSS
jgi:NAD(P)-dependent dehydrogenase (short-subunit alcohol dehydrogenase family)